MLRDIALITGIPRETARRRLESLQQGGWFVQTDEGWLLLKRLSIAYLDAARNPALSLSYAKNAK